MRAVLALLMLVLALPVAAAQAPPVCDGLALGSPPAPAAIAAGETADLVVTIDNTGNLAMRVDVQGSVTTPGWAIEAQPEPVVVPSGGSGTVTFRVRANDPDEDAVLTFTGTGTCQTPLGNDIPQPDQAEAVGATVPLAASEGIRFPGLSDLNFPLEYLLAGIVLVGIATAIPFLMKRKKAGVTAECPEPLKMVKPGRGTSFPIELRNAGGDATTTSFDVSPVPEGWSAFMPLPEVQLAGREARSLWLMVRSPPNAANGDSVDVELRLRDPKKEGAPMGPIVRIRAEVQGAGEPG